MKLPIARTTELLEQEADKELLVYDLRIDKAYNLNETSKNVFKACDGISSFEDLKRRHNYTDDLIYLTLDELKKTGLVEGGYDSPFAGMSRREVIRRTGLACAAALPVISVLLAPQAASAASTCTTAVCIPSGQNICAGCSGRINVTIYSPANSNCRNSAGSFTYTCNPGVAFTYTGYDARRSN